MNAESLNSEITKFFTRMMVFGAALILTNKISSAAIEIGVELITMILLLIVGVVLSVIYIVMYVAILFTSYKNHTQFGLSWGNDPTTALEDACRFDNTLMLVGSTSLMVLFLTHSWVLWGVFGASLFGSFITSVRILVLCIREANQ